MIIIYNIILILNYVCLIVFVLVGIAFFTLLERRVLGYIQLRKGPNKVSIIGIFQPFADAVKLFTKGNNKTTPSNFMVYYVRPGIIIIIIILLWGLYLFDYKGLDFKFGIIYFLCCSRIGVYSLFCSGWASNSKYALLGSLRGIAQSISYEVSLALIILVVIIIIIRYSLEVLVLYQNLIWLMWVMPSLFIVLFVSILAETNRTPFDFAEGESELVSGFNVEYRAGLFALLFIREYGRIMFISYFVFLICFGGQINILFSVVLIIVLFIWLRGTIPRFRYDRLIYLAWKRFLPIILNIIIYINGLILIFIWNSKNSLLIK